MNYFISYQKQQHKLTIFYESAFKHFQILNNLHLILNDEFNFLVDMNFDQQVNVLDVIQLVNIILNRCSY